jgi:valyl-tRNA synthetase
VTEELWGHLKEACQEQNNIFIPGDGWEEALIVAHWLEETQPVENAAEKIEEFQLLQEIVRSIRNLRAEKNVTPGRRIHATIAAADQRLDLLSSQKNTIAYLAYLDTEHLELVPQFTGNPSDQVSLVVSGIEIYLPLADLVDPQAELERLQKELDNVQGQIERLEKLLGSEFARKAPPEVVEKERGKLATFRESAGKLQTQIESLRS